MTRDQLESVAWREGLTRLQVDAILAAADAYATSQASQAIHITRQPPVHYLNGAVLACNKTHPVNVVNTTDRGRVTCSVCRNTRAWKETPA